MRDFALETFFSKWEFAARYHLTASDVQSLSLSELLSMAEGPDRLAFEQQWLGYTQTYGLPELRAVIAETYETATADDILCFAGAQEGVYVAMRVLLDRSDHAIVVVPNYQSAETLPLDICEVSGIPLNADDRWSLDIDQLRRHIRPNTKLVSINFPNNPTGAVLARDRFDALVELCRERGIFLFSDEVYRLLERDESRRLPQAGDAYERALSLNVMSKAYGLPGLRVGWIMCKDPRVRLKMERYKHYLSICNSAPSERLALIALKARETILNRSRELIRHNLTELQVFFDEFPALFNWVPPDGGCVGFPRYTGADGAEAFCRRVVEESGVLLLPPHIYRSELLPAPPDRFRIGFGRRGMAEGLAALRAHLRANR